MLEFTKQDGTKSSYKAMPHFCINTNWKIIQFIDVCENVEHGESLSSYSIGIEFVNHPWGQDKSIQDGKENGGITPLQIPYINGYPSLDGKHIKTCLYIPSEKQIEALITLLNGLFSLESLNTIKQNWLNVININHKKIKTENTDDLKAYFIINNAKIYLTNKIYNKINENQNLYGWAIDAPGIFNHSLFGTHSDGMILILYAWLRIEQKMNKENTITTIKNILIDESLRQDGGNNVVLVDISKIVFATV